MRMLHATTGVTLNATLSTPNCARAPLNNAKKNIGLLAACQALLMTNNSIMIATTGLAGLALTPTPALATLPVAGYVCGGALTTMAASLLMKRCGLMTIMVTGVALNLVCVAIALNGIAVWNFWLAMVLVGVGWNFMYIGATALLTETYKPAEKAKAQGFNESTIFVTLALSSLFSGALFTLQGWDRLNMLAVPFLIAVGAALLWLGVRRPTH